jgi:hypothetical protein
MVSKTIRRDVLKRLIAAGRVVGRGSYNFDDMYGESRSSGRRVPVALMPDKIEDRHKLAYDGKVWYLFDSDFSSKSGHAYGDPKGKLTLYVHSNSNYDLEILPEPVVSWLPPIKRS